MNIDWASLGLVGIVSLAVSVIVVALVAFSLVGFSARENNGQGAVSPATGTAIGVVCLVAVAVVVLYGLYIIAEKFLHSLF